MIWLNFDGWLRASSRWLIRKRILVFGYVWTPFVIVKFRFKRLVDIDKTLTDEVLKP